MKKKRTNWVSIVTLVINLLAFFLGGGLWYNKVYQRPVLEYTVLPSYNLGDSYASGLVVTNGGRVPITNVQVILSDLEFQLATQPSMPGLHEPVQVLQGGMGHTGMLAKTPRLSTENLVTVYFSTEGPISLEPQRTVMVTSEETTGVPAPEKSEVDPSLGWVLALISFNVLNFIVVMQYFEMKGLNRQLWQAQDILLDLGITPPGVYVKEDGGVG